MASVLTETKLIILSGAPEGRARVCGINVNTATTSFVISPGHADSNVSGSIGLRSIDSWGLSNASAEKAPIVVKSYSSSVDADILTVTCASGDDYNYWVEGTYVGQ